MTSLTPYVVFPGTCREALEFYQGILDGEITDMTTFGESPVPVDAESESRIYNAELRFATAVLKASDDLPSHPVTQGTNISLFVSFPTLDTRDKAFADLVEGGTTLFPPDGPFGMLEDRFGVRWMLVVQE